MLVQWSAARAERRGRTWKSARELALEGERWEVPARRERGYTKLLPDLAVWLTPSGPPWAVIAESGGRREDRQKLILEGWREAVHGGRFAGVRYDCANESVAPWIKHLAKKVLLTAPAFSVIVQTSAKEIADLARADAEAEEQAGGEAETSARVAPADDGRISIGPVDAPVPRARWQQLGPNDPPRNQKRQRRPPKESDAIGRSSGSRSQSRGDDGDADAGAFPEQGTSCPLGCLARQLVLAGRAC